MKTDGNAPIGVIDGMYGDDAMAGNHTGLTKREHFAAMAMQALSTGHSPTLGNEPINEIANSAVRIADALIKALNK